MHSLWLPGGLAPPGLVISSGRKSLYERHTASTEAYSVKMAALSSAITRFALWQKLLFSRRTNEDKLTTKQLGLPRPNVSIQQVSTKGGKSYIQELERKKIAVVKWLTRSVFLYTTVTFHRFHSVFHSSLLALTLNNFLCDDLFCFCKPILSRSVNKYCWFWLMLPLLYDVTGHIMCPVKLCYIIQHLRHVDNEKVG